jgi:hypothetical protein
VIVGDSDRLLERSPKIRQQDRDVGHDRGLQPIRSLMFLGHVQREDERRVQCWTIRRLAPHRDVG